MCASRQTGTLLNQADPELPYYSFVRHKTQMSRTYKDQRQFDRKQDYRTKREYQDKMPIVENDNRYDVMQTINPDWSNF